MFYLLSYIKRFSPLALFLANGGLLGLGFTSATQSVLKFINLSDCLVSASQVAWATGPCH